jgi:hypothetical protein
MKAATLRVRPKTEIPDPLGMMPGVDFSTKGAVRGSGSTTRRTPKGSHLTDPSFDRRNQPPDRPRHPRE